MAWERKMSPVFTNSRIWASNKFYYISWGNKIRNAKINVANKTTLAAGGHRDIKEDFKSTET